MAKYAVRAQAGTVTVTRLTKDDDDGTNLEYAYIGAFCNGYGDWEVFARVEAPNKGQAEQVAWKVWFDAGLEQRAVQAVGKKP